MPNPNTSTQEWYYHAPGKKTNAEAKEAPAPSQIPGLSNVPGDPLEELAEDRHFRRKWVRDTDSKYVKLAKGGGRKDLLAYRQQKPVGTPVDYPRVDWFDHVQPVEEEHLNELAAECNDKNSQTKPRYRSTLPDWYVHDHPQSFDEELSQPTKGQYNSRRQIMSFDNLSAWEREAKDASQDKNRVRLPPIHGRRKQHRAEQHRDEQLAEPAGRRTERLPKLDEAGAVDFKHLMSMGYQRDWFQDLKMQKTARNAQRKKELQENDEKRASQMRDAITMRKPKKAIEDGKVELFKLSRFEKVQPKVESFRT